MVFISFLCIVNRSPFNRHNQMRKIFYVVAGLLIVSGRMSIAAQQAVVDTTNVYELNEVVVSAV